MLFRAPRFEFSVSTQAGGRSSYKLASSHIPSRSFHTAGVSFVFFVCFPFLPCCPSSLPSFFRSCAGDQIQGLLHAGQILYHCVTSPALSWSPEESSMKHLGWGPPCKPTSPQASAVTSVFPSLTFQKKEEQIGFMLLLP